MNDTKYIIEANVHIFIENLIDAIKDGYRIDNTNYGWLMEANGLKEINLSYDPERKYPEVALGEVTITNYNAQEFLDQICQVVAAGGVLDVNSLTWDMTGIKSIRGKVYKLPEYTKEELANMDWETFKSSVKSVVGTGRDRSLMTSRYLASTGQLV